MDENYTPRLLVFGDTHGSTLAVKQAVDAAVQHGVTDAVSVGDFGFWPGDRGRRFLHEVTNYARQHGVTLWVVPGNHDDYDYIESLEYEDHVATVNDSVHVIDRGGTVTINDVSVFGMSGATSIDGPNGIWGRARWSGHGWWAREDIDYNDYAKAVRNLDSLDSDIDLMVSHDAPMGAEFINEAFEPFAASVKNKLFLDSLATRAAPQLCVWGHYHKRMSGTIAPFGVPGECLHAVDFDPDQSMLLVKKHAAGRLQWESV